MTFNAGRDLDLCSMKRLACCNFPLDGLLVHRMLSQHFYNLNFAIFITPEESFLSMNTFPVTNYSLSEIP